MNMPPIAVTVLGRGPLADLLTHRIGKRADLTLIATLPTDAEPPAATACVLYLPTRDELADGTSARHVTALLRAGFDVVSTAPPIALGHRELLDACRTGASTFHGSGGFQSTLISRFHRAVTSIARNLRRVELVEELDVDEVPPHPWTTAADTGLDAADSSAAQTRTLAVDAYYEAGLHTLSEAAFGQDGAAEPLSRTVTRVHPDSGPKRIRTDRQTVAEQVIVRRTLGEQVAYDSIWTQSPHSAAPLRYRFSSVTDDATGHVNLDFHREGNVHPADHLASYSLLNAIHPVHGSAPGILHQDLDINRVKRNECLAG